MWQSFKEYVLATGRWGWVILVDILLAAAGAYLDISGKWGLPTWVWATMLVVAVLIAPFIAFHKVRKERDEARNEVASVISELESDTVRLGGHSVNMATLFWKLGQRFLQGIQPGSINGTIYTTFQGAYPEESRKAEENLMSKLRLLELVRDDQRQHLDKGYTVIITTSLGASVLRELAKKWR
jgi:hypothetical protein